MVQLEHRALGRPTERHETVSNPVDDLLMPMSRDEIVQALRELDELTSD